MILGHTKFKYDSSFGLIKRSYNNTKINCVDYIVEVINRPSISRLNTAWHYNVREAVSILQYFK
jgi:hypothetical protein